MMMLICRKWFLYIYLLDIKLVQHIHLNHENLINQENLIALSNIICMEKDFINDLNLIVMVVMLPFRKHTTYITYAS